MGLRSSKTARAEAPPSAASPRARTHSPTRALTSTAATSAAEKDGIPSRSELWVTVRTRTTCKRRNMSEKKHVAFLATRTGVSIGAHSDADIVLSDAAMEARHVAMGAAGEGEELAVALTPLARVYMMIGQGSRGQAGMPGHAFAHAGARLVPGSIAKLGAVSLLCADVCTGLPAPGGELSPRARPGSPTAEGAPMERPAGDVCYICFDDTNEPTHMLVRSPCVCAALVHRACVCKWIATRGSRTCSICKSKLPVEFTVDPPYIVLSVVRHMRGLHWTGEREYIISFKNRAHHCVTIGSGGDCDVVLPDPSLSRLHSRITYYPANAVPSTVLTLPAEPILPAPARSAAAPPPAAEMHATARNAAASAAGGVFVLEDMQSSAGTFVKLTQPYTCTTDGPAVAFKLGRTMISVKVRRRRPGGSAVSPESWRSMLSRGSTQRVRSNGANTTPSPLSPAPGISPASSSSARGPRSRTARAHPAEELSQRARTMPPLRHVGEEVVGDQSLTAPTVVESDDDMLAAALVASAREYAALMAAQSGAAALDPSLVDATASAAVVEPVALPVVTAPPVIAEVHVASTLLPAPAQHGRAILLDMDPDAGDDDMDLPDLDDFEGGEDAHGMYRLPRGGRA